MNNKLFEDDIEQFAIELLQNLGYTYRHGSTIAPGAAASERADFGTVVLWDRLRRALTRLNPTLPAAAIAEAENQLRRLGTNELLEDNATFHGWLTRGVEVSVQEGGKTITPTVWLLDERRPRDNEFWVVNQLRVEEKNRRKRPDVVLYINGLPLVVLELKNATRKKATIKTAYNQLEDYKYNIPSLFIWNSLLVISDGLAARAGSLSAGYDRFMPWKTEDGRREAARLKNELEVLINGMLRPTVLLDLVQHFTVFEKEKKQDRITGLLRTRKIKKIAGYHQYYAVRKAVQTTIRAATAGGDQKGGVFWHTQGSGKSLSMVFYTHLLEQAAALENPTVVVVTDRNDLDGQLFASFANVVQYFQQSPVAVASRQDLIRLLTTTGGGIIFTTIQKFLPERRRDEPPAAELQFPLLTARRNVIVIVDEAHRSQYGTEAKLRDVKDADGTVIGKQLTYGYAKYLRKDALPNATFIGFTGTPIERIGQNTRGVFGDYIDIYDIKAAEEDRATVPIYYESRLAQVRLEDEGRELIAQLDADLENDNESAADRIRRKWSQLEKIVGHPERLENLARDLVAHFDKRAAVFQGKAMIVCMSRRIACRLYEQIVKIRPDWHDADLQRGTIKVVMTSSPTDDPDEIPHLHRTTKSDRDDLRDRMQEPADALKIAIVCDMWLTGFNVPSLHTMYLDKVLRGHTLMQAITRVNRVYREKPGGLIVDYLGVADELKRALAFYSNSGGEGNPFNEQEEAVKYMLEKLEVVHQFYHGFNYQSFFGATVREKLSLLLAAANHILGLDNGKDRYLKEMAALNKLYALATGREEADRIRDEMAFLQAVEARLVKFDGEEGGGGSTGGTGTGNGQSGMETAIKQVIDRALSSERVVDIFDAAGMEKPDISVLSNEFLQEVKDLPYKNIAVETLKKVLNDEIRSRSKYNLIKGKTLMEMLEKAILRYQNQVIDTAAIIEELIALAAHLRANDAQQQAWGLTDYEMAFYDAVAVNPSARSLLGDDTLRELARLLVARVRANASIDWTVRDDIRAKLRVTVKRLLRRYGYPPDQEKLALARVLRQAEVLAGEWGEELPRREFYETTTKKTDTTTVIKITLDQDYDDFSGEQIAALLQRLERELELSAPLRLVWKERGSTHLMVQLKNQADLEKLLNAKQVQAWIDFKVRSIVQEELAKERAMQKEVSEIKKWRKECKRQLSQEGCEALLKMLFDIDCDPEIIDEVTSLLSQWNELQQQIRLGVVRHEDRMVHHNQITNSVIGVVNRVQVVYFN